MLLVMGRNQVGNVVHAILGPESDIFLDIHGATMVNVTVLLANVDMTQQTYLAVTRCKSEVATEAYLQATNISYISSFGGGKPNAKPTKSATPVMPSVGGGSTNANPTTTGCCDYCHQTLELLPLAGFKICASCAQIELGIKRNKEDTGPCQTDHQS